jgi:hypothetical protein
VLQFAAQAFAQCGTVAVITPSNGGTVQRTPDETVLFKWDAFPGATSYDVYFGGPGQGCTSPRATVTSPSWEPPAADITNGAQYEWRVVANGLPQCQTPPTSGCRTFTVAPCPNAAPLISPSNGATVSFGAITLDWDAVANVHDFQLYIGIDGDTPSLHAVQTSTSKNIVVEPGRTTEWYVVSRAHGCPGAESAHFVFSTNCPSGGPGLGSPSNGATFNAGTPVTFNWSTVPGSAGYDVKINDGQGWQVVAENLTTTSHTMALAEGEYEWEVRANFNGSCAPAYSEIRELVIGAACAAGEAPRLVNPANNATVNSPVTFEWDPTANAQKYLLRVKKSGGTVRTLAETTGTVYRTTELAAGTYEWWVVADYPACPNVESTRRTVTISGSGGGCPTNPAKATLVSPANGATGLSSPVKFQWNAVNGAIGYRVLAAFNNGEPAIIGSTTSTSLTAALPAGSGTWLVQTVFGDGCDSTFSDRRTFTVANGAPCSTTPPQLASPANGSTTSNTAVTFSWTAITAATSYKLFVAPDDDEDFRLYGETTGTSLEKFVPAGSLRWFVIASFAACPDLRSAISTFVVIASNCPAASIELRAPANNSTTTSPVRFEWTAFPGATGYRVWVSFNGAAPVNVARTETNSATVPLPAGTMTWYVEGQRGDCFPIVSPTSSFTVTPGAACSTNVAPTLVSPAGPNGNPVGVSNVNLVWTAVNGAIGYRVWVGRNGSAFSDVKLTRETSTTVDLADGVYGWYVEALFEGCNPLASATSFFSLASANSACSTAAPSALAPAEGASTTSPVTFSWSAVPNAEKYRLFAAISGGEPQLLGTTEDTQLTRALPPGSFLWSVEAVFAECPSTFSPRTRFTIPEGQNCATTGATLVVPANGATNVIAPIDFAWSSVPGAVKYVLVAKVNNGAPTAFANTTDTHFVVEKVPSGTIEWWVITYFAACDPVEAAHARFTVAPPAGCDNRKPILLLPTDRVSSPVHFEWTAVPRATGYKVWVAKNGGSASIAASSPRADAEVKLPEGTYEWYVEALFENCPSTQSARAEFTVIAPVACGTPERTKAQVVGQTLSGTEYRLRWKSLANVALYEVQEATSPSFANATTFTTTTTSMPFRHEVSGAAVQYVYRVRGISNCNEERGTFSDPVAVVVTPPKSTNASTEIGQEGTVVQTVFLPGSTEPYTFVATVDKPWLTVTPSSGVLPATGITLNVTADPSALKLGTNTGTIKVQYTAGSGKGTPGVNALTTVNLPTSVSLVTPVFPSGKGTPPPDSLIFPVVGHAEGFNNSLFESDIRVTNLTAKTMKYELNFTPSGTNGTKSGSSSTIEIASGSTLALDDVVATMFGAGTLGPATGMLEVRPLETAASPSGSLFETVFASAIKQLETAASSRTYNFTPTGTFGQYIPATRFGDFIGRAAAGFAPQILSLQQVAQSSAFRANFGFAEAAGESAELMVRVYDTASQLLATIPVFLQASEHRQLNGMLAANGINDLQDGRVEVEVVGGNGKVTAYVSEVDNVTNDPLLVSPVLKGSVTANRYVVPGTAFANTGAAFWVTDLRVFNAGDAATPATLTFYPMSNPSAAVTREMNLGAGEIKVLDNVIGELFGQPNGAGGMVAITTPTETRLTATARTYNKTISGTYGQYIPGVTVAQSVGVADRPLQLLQLEHSSRFRTNIGIAETSGQPVTVEVSLILPDSLTTPVVEINLGANEFRQFSIGEFGAGVLYNARVAVKVIGGEGRVTAYGSAIDQLTNDPTYVPAQ